MTSSNFKTSFIIGDSWKATNLLLSHTVFRDGNEIKARPPLIKVHNNLAQAQAIHNALGDDTVVIVRMIGAEWAAQRDRAPNEAALRWCQVMEPALQAAPWAYFEIGPPLQFCDDWYCAFLLAAMNWMHARGYLGVAMTVGEGNPETKSGGGDGWAPMWPVVQLAASYGYILGPQAYWVDGGMDVNDDWHMFRMYRVFRDYPGMFPAGTRIAFTETGIDLRNGLGWQAALGGDWSFYRAGLRILSSELNRRVCPPGVEIIGGTVFAVHEVSNQWDNFNILNELPDLLDDIIAGQGIVEVPPEPPVEQPALAGITVKSPGCNMRRDPTVNSDWLGFAAPGSEFNVEYPPTNEYNYIPDLDCWIWGNNIYIA